jgi:tRNA uridine 5-carboxymethylaminomethyl modification enzyme
MNKTHHYDVIVVGGGHAGIEAAHAAAKLGSKTLLITLDIEKIGLMPCNPAVGGVGKGHIVFEISALGGLMPRLCTKTYLQARMLNTSKGPAVQGLRLQIDKYAYNELAVATLKKLPNLTLLGTTAEDILLDGQNRVLGVVTKEGEQLTAPTVILTTGTFLNGKIHIGKFNQAAGRRGEQAVTGLSLFLNRSGLKLGRLKTGTPPRLLRSSLDFSQLEHQEADKLNYLFEFYPHTVENSHDCFIAHTNENTHKIIADNLHQSAMYNGNISGIGPRYCPSIEDKIGRFPDKNSHHVFVEPEGANTDEIYPNGISTSLPEDVQLAYVRSIKGFENAIIAKPGYAVEYDFVLPNQLNLTLEVETIPGLFLAGQINGTTGYEEAAGQGLLAGINAHQKAHNKEPFILERDESYIGVMIDDLVTMGVDEPYRMFTSRAERRLLLRQDNVFIRLMPRAYELGLIDETLYADFCAEKALIEETIALLRTAKEHAEIKRRWSVDLGSREELEAITGKPHSERAALIIHAELRYEPYIERERLEIKRREQHKALRIPDSLVFDALPGLSKELQQKLNKYRPATIADAALLPGMTPAAITLLIFKIKKQETGKISTP